MGTIGKCRCDGTGKICNRGVVDRNVRCIKTGYGYIGSILLEGHAGGDGRASGGLSNGNNRGGKSRFLDQYDPGFT